MDGGQSFTGARKMDFSGSQLALSLALDQHWAGEAQPLRCFRQDQGSLLELIDDRMGAHVNGPFKKGTFLH